MTIRKRRREVFQHGHYFLLPLSDGRFARGQVVYAIPTMRAPVIALYEPALRSASATGAGRPNKRKLILCCAVTPDRLEDRAWTICGRDVEAIDVRLLQTVLNLALRKFVGLTIVDSGMLTSCLELHFETPESRSYSEKLRLACRAMLAGESGPERAQCGFPPANLGAREQKPVRSSSHSTI